MEEKLLVLISPCVTSLYLLFPDVLKINKFMYVKYHIRHCQIVWLISGFGRFLWKEYLFMPRVIG